MHAMDKNACPKQTRESIVKQMICHQDEVYHNMFELFLQKFKVLDKINWNEDLVADNIKFVCQEINNEYIDAVFMDFSVSKYRHIGWPLSKAIEFILDRFDEYSKIPIIPILSIKYESPKEAQFKIAKIIDDKIGEKICGIDFVGDESKFNPKIQSKICEMWDGKFVRLHVGESGHIDNIIESMKFKGITNIAHGIKIIKNQEYTNIAKDVNCIFDVAPTSNYTTGVVHKNDIHPSIKMHRDGLKVTIGSDDPIQLLTDVHNEAEILSNHGITHSELMSMINNGHEQFLKWKKYARCTTKHI